MGEKEGTEEGAREAMGEEGVNGAGERMGGGERRGGNENGRRGGGRRC